MADRCDQGVRADHHIISDVDFPNVQNSQIIVAGKVRTDINVLSIVTVERFGYPDRLSISQVQSYFYLLKRLSCRR